jgi:predicted O-methyltransferase YrrM
MVALPTAPAPETMEDRLRAAILFRTNKTYDPIVVQARKFSMLHDDVLFLLAYFAETTEAGILEIGPYVGGSTVAIAAGNAGRRRAFVTIEAGGSYKEHPHLPSNDILGDLRSNIARFGFEHSVSVVEGWCYKRSVKRRVQEIFGDEKIGLLVIDADGLLEPSLRAYCNFLRDDCVIVIDDYEAAGSALKEELVRPFVLKKVREGIFVEYGVFGWGTWIGRLNGQSAINLLQSARETAFPKAVGFSYFCFLEGAEPADTLDSLARSRLRLFENDVELGPPHSLHKAIRNHGNGQFSHWSTANATEDDDDSSVLLFSTSDNSDPNTNGRSYRIAFGDGKLVPLVQLLDTR